MNSRRHLLAALSCLTVLTFLSFPAQATSSTAAYPCSIERSGVEQCGTIIRGTAADQTQPEQCDQDCQNAAAKTRLQRYCASQKKAGKSTADGLCAQLSVENR